MAIPAAPESRGTPATHRCGETGHRPLPRSWFESTIVARFRDAARRHEDCTALVDGDESLTYGELSARAGGVGLLVTERAGSDRSPVVLAFEQGAASTVATLGVLAAGRAYVPLALSDPPARLASAADAVGARLILTDRRSVERIEPLASPTRAVVPIDDAGTAELPPVPIDPAAPAYVFFTSGSTGIPKGVVDCHRNVLHNVWRYTNALGIGPGERLSLLQAPSFSGAVSSLFCALLNGATSYPLRLHELALDGLAARIAAERITMLHCVPSILRSLSRTGQRFPDVHTLRLEGDRATSRDVELHRRSFAPGSRLVNGLGLTETGLVSQLFVEHGDAIEDGPLPVGFPLPDVEVALVEEDGSPVPPGDVGEIVVRSDFLALGYWGRPEPTAEAFGVDDSGRRTYRTGDLGRLRADGCLEHLGRVDHQLKVGGSRVDPVEVEVELMRLDGIREALVSTREGRRGEGQLVAYVVPDGEAPSAAAMRAALAGRLPGHLVPTRVVAVGSLPLGPSGKVDRRAVRDEGGDRPSVAPRDDEERLVASIWSDVFETDVGIDDDFFELGGDSLAVQEILAGIERATGVVLSPGVLMSAPTAAGLAEAVRSAARQSASSLRLLVEGAGGTPIVVCHGLDGSLRDHVHLVPALGSRSAIWGLEHRGDAALPLDELAGRHAARIAAEIGGGPVAIVGFCFGGLVGLEVARALRDRGANVRLLALVGVSPRDFPTLVSRRAARRWRHERVRATPARAARHLRAAASLPLGEAVRYALRRLPSLVRPRGEDWWTPGEAVRVDEARRALAAHRARPYPGDLVVVLPSASAARYTRTPARDWAGLATGTVHVTVAEGEDWELVSPPGVEATARVLRRALSDAEGAAEGRSRIGGRPPA